MKDGEGRHNSLLTAPSPSTALPLLAAQLILSEPSSSIQPSTSLPSPPFLTCLNLDPVSGLLASATSEPGSRGAQTEQVRTWMHQAPAPPATRPHPRIKGRKSACSLLLLADCSKRVKRLGNSATRLRAQPPGASRATLPRQPLKSQASEIEPVPCCFGPQGWRSKQQRKEPQENRATHWALSVSITIMIYKKFFFRQLC